MAEELNITTSAYSKIERGDTDASTSRLLQIAEVLEVSVTDFFEDAVASFRDDIGKYGYATKEEMENLTKVVNSLAQKIEKLTEELPATKHSSGKRNKKSGSRPE